MKTKLQIYLSAEKAALESLACLNQFEIADFANTAFKAEGLSPKDWDFWYQTYGQQRQVYVQWNKEKSNTPNPES